MHKHSPTPTQRRQVEVMAAHGITEPDIARAIGPISDPTLRKYYKSELALGHIKANLAVAQSLYRKAIGDGPQSVTAAIFWAKTRMRWSDRHPGSW